MFLVLLKLLLSSFFITLAIASDVFFFVAAVSQVDTASATSSVIYGNCYVKD